MPESRSRKKPQSSDRPVTVIPEDKPNPVWFVPLFVGLLVLGLVWVVITYISQSAWPIPALGAWNLGVGFGFILAGFIMTMRWR